MFGKIENGILVLTGYKIQIKNGWITNPTVEQLEDNGYYQIHYNKKPEYNIEEEKLVERYTLIEMLIDVTYEKVALTDEEKRQNLALRIKKEKEKMYKN